MNDLPVTLIIGPRKPKRGFASMDPQRQREIAALGGQAAQQQGRAYKWTSEKAREAAKLSHSSPKRAFKGIE